MGNTIIRTSTLDDFARLREIFAIARVFMSDTGNLTQWTDGYPCDELIMNDIKSGDSFVIIHDDVVVATFVLRPGIDPTYNAIYEGAWLNEEPYATVHRIASSGEIKGVFHLAMQFAKQKYVNVRIDTHRDNMVMQNAIKKEGFKYCGIIYCWNGDERLAFQFSKNP
ncbi:MAG: GNAT family N-acetyltransferase [Candidatus Limimorpha sp.]